MILALNVTLFLIFLASLFNVVRERDRCSFIYAWAFPLFTYVWEDLLIFSIFFLGLVNVASFFGDLRIALLGAILYCCVRSAGETLYYFLQQFHEPQHHPHDIDSHLGGIRRILGPISYQKALIIMQITYQVSLTFSLMGLILLIMNWKQIPTFL